MRFPLTTITTGSSRIHGGRHVVVIHVRLVWHTYTYIPVYIRGHENEGWYCTLSTVYIMDDVWDDPQSARCPVHWSHGASHETWVWRHRHHSTALRDSCLVTSPMPWWIVDCIIYIYILILRTIYSNVSLFFHDCHTENVHFTSSTCGVRMVPTRKEARTSNPQRKYRNEHGSDVDESSSASSTSSSSIITCLDHHHVTVGRRENRIVVFMRVYVESSSFVLVVTTATSSNGAHINTPIYIYTHIIRGGSAAIFPTLRRRVAVGRNPFFGPHNLRQTAPHVTKIVTWVSHSSSCACMYCVYSSYEPAMLILLFVCWIVLLLNVIYHCQLSNIQLDWEVLVLTPLTKDTNPGYFGKAEVVGKLTYRY